jgi:hypothetical protein
MQHPLFLFLTPLRVVGSERKKRKKKAKTGNSKVLKILCIVSLFSKVY